MVRDESLEMNGEKSMNVTFITIYPSPYRVEFFNQLGKCPDIHLTVIFLEGIEKQTHRDKKWFNTSYKNFKAIFLKEKIQLGRKGVLYKDITKYICKKNGIYFLCGYSTPTFMLAMEYLHWKNIPYVIEIDGGIIAQDSWLKKWVKKHFLSSGQYYFCSGEESKKYLVHYGANAANIQIYPFSSMTQKDMATAWGDTLLSEEEWILRKKAVQEEARTKLGIQEKYMVVGVGQFCYRKGWDVLLKACKNLGSDVGVYIVGGQSTDEYNNMKKEYHLDHIHFIDFMAKADLSTYYKAADLFVLPTRYDVWGLVINEAMVYGLPVITTDACIAGMELVINGENGYICRVGDVKSLEDCLTKIWHNDMLHMGYTSYQKIQPYTIENMVQKHYDFLMYTRGKLWQEQ